MRLLTWITGNTKKNGIQNEEIYLKDRETIDEKMRGSHLKWFGYVQRNVINILIDSSSKRTMSIKEATKSKSKLCLDWPTCFSVCLGTTRGLAYLHEESRPRIVHRDVKASNILIDRELCPKISNFGLAKFYDDTKTHINTRVAGTIGYFAPEYAMRGHLTEKADVLSFGVVALEILSGRLNLDNSLDTEKIYLLEWAWTLHENNQILRLVDPTLSEFDENEAARVIAVSLLCTQASPNMRPPMSRVVAMLAGDIEVGIVTSKQSYLTDWNLKDITSSFWSEEDRKHHGITLILANLVIHCLLL
ncbi:putative LRR receptor-like serine/threonine-protein kinase At1g56140 [Castanea sativa]|uniref:putative LRR receptor-like serine/threonine-protein kinase At1g56140 n=1 Tax=Castanea sativa TaxID=21020 RepID=UPI003F650830